MTDTTLMSPDLSLIKGIKKAGGENVKKCYQCATCSVVCNLSPDDRPFPRKEMILAGWGQTDKLVADPDLWMCYQCNDCSTHCPRNAKPGDVLAAIRTYIYQNFAFPSFMGRALANKAALPFLFLLPVVLLIGCILISAPKDVNGVFEFTTASTIDFNWFLPHSTVDALFVFGNIIIFIFAAIGFLRFWKGLKNHGGQTELSFVSAFIKTVIDIFTHKTFFDCDTNKPRAWGHILLFAGFVGSMIVTGAVFILIFIPHYAHEWHIFNINILPMPPIELPNPIKILGAISGLALVIGGIMLIYRRWTNRDEVGANGYADYLFLYVMFFVGLTGMLSWIFRAYVGIPYLAYGTYFVHMVFVFFLLWYMPYSKFAHMIYRTLALTYCKSIGRKAVA
jgi:quinone-modifying oxidoreductase subunit QmoC